MSTSSASGGRRSSVGIVLLTALLTVFAGPLFSAEPPAFPKTPLTSASASKTSAATNPSSASTSATVTAFTDVALAVVYDTSGSMRSPIRTKEGAYESKDVIAKRAFNLVIDRLEGFAQPAADKPAKTLNLSVVIFAGTSVREALPMAPFNATAARNWVNGLPRSDAVTPLGDAISRAGDALLKTSAASKHLLVLTDGENTTGSTPIEALTALQKKTRTNDQSIFVHVLALDISPKVFVSLEKAGATVVGAADEKQLQSQLDFILETQILVEAP